MNSTTRFTSAFTFLLVACSLTCDADEASMDTVELIKYYGYPAETHTVQTEDGYILEIHRIPHSKKKSNLTKSGIPILMESSFLCTSRSFVDNTAEISLGFLLADEGYDVWLGNIRGTTYGLKHETLSPDSNDFWQFSWDDSADYDVPNTIDYILRQTGFLQLLYVGHSQGNTMALAMLSTKAEYREKVKGVVCLAPVATLGHIKGLKDLFPYIRSALKTAGEWFQINPILSNSWVLKKLVSIFCPNFSPVITPCEAAIYASCGYDPWLMNRTRIQTFMNSCPAGTSYQTVDHWAQLVKSKKFMRYDFGSKEKNLKKYGQPTAPEYNLKELSVPVALFWSQNDNMADPTDVSYLAKTLPKVVRNYEVPYHSFNHLDFIWATKSRSLVYYAVLEVLRDMWTM